MRIAFIKNNTVEKIFVLTDIVGISKANHHKDWQARVLTDNNAVAAGWLYNPETRDLTAS